jgi:hypothetical protein
VWLLEQVGRSRLIASMTGPSARPAYHTDSIEQRAGCACRECNNGWMSELEQLTQAASRPMVDGKPVELSGQQQMIVAAWMLKTLMVFDWVMGEKFWRQEERELLFQRELGPALKDCTTYAGHYIGTYKALAYPRRQPLRRFDGEDTGVPIFSGILIVGSVMMWLQKDRYREATGRDCVLHPPKHFERLTKLGVEASPSINWPPQQASFDDSAFSEFTGEDAG